MKDRLIRTIVVEDEPIAQRGLVALLTRHADIQVVAKCDSALAAAIAIRDQRPELMFLDIHLPGADGFTSTDDAPEEARPVIIVTTAYPDHALRAYQHGAISYLIKPLTEEGVDEALDRARALIQRRPAGATPDYTTRLTVRVDDGMVLLRTADIEWIEAADDCARIHIADRAQLVRETLGDLERALDPARFIRVHRSAIVNIDRVRAIRPQFNGRYTLVLASGTRVVTSRSRRATLATALGRPL